MKASKPLFAVQAVLTALLVLSASIAVPILCRPFYYAHIPSIQAFTGGTVEEIRQIIGADSLSYLSTGRLREMAGGLSICAACFDGNYPVEPPSEDIRGSYER